MASTAGCCARIVLNVSAIVSLFPEDIEDAIDRVRDRPRATNLRDEWHRRDDVLAIAHCLKLHRVAPTLELVGDVIGRLRPCIRIIARLRRQLLHMRADLCHGHLFDEINDVDTGGSRNAGRRYGTARGNQHHEHREEEP